MIQSCESIVLLLGHFLEGTSEMDTDNLLSNFPFDIVNKSVNFTFRNM